MSDRAYIAVDLGAESGRVIVGAVSEAGAAPPSAGSSSRLSLHEVHRFEHRPRQIGDGLCWDVEHLWRQIRLGLQAAATRCEGSEAKPVSVGVDTWGVDFALLDREGRLIAPARCYRDPRHTSGMEVLRSRIGFDRLYGLCGIQEMSINTLVQLAALRQTGVEDAGVLEQADRLLMMPDYFHFLLSGQARNESTIASTTQMLDANAPPPGRWSGEVMSAVGFPTPLVRDPIAPGTLVGTILPSVAQECGLPADLRVVAPGSHDTASAVAGVPATGSSWAYISSGTWSLMGAEVAAPVLTGAAHDAGFSNERGVASTFRFQKNLIGLWLVQEVRRDLERSGTSLGYGTLTELARGAEPFRTRIDAAHSPLAFPGEAIAKLRAYARSVGDPEPVTPGDLVRCSLESLAMAYRRCLESLESLLARRFDTIHIVGGGSKNTLLAQMAADATGRRVLAGPVEATAAGNVLVQAMADGSSLNDLHAIREVVSRSFDLVEYLPGDIARWNAQYARHQQAWELST